MNDRQHTNSTPDPTPDLRVEGSFLEKHAMVTPEDFGLAFKDASEIRANAPRPHTARLRWVRITAVAVAAAIAFMIVLVNRPERAQQTPPPPVPVHFETAAQVLAAASTAEHASFDDLSDANYWRVESVYQIGRDAPANRTVWKGHRGPGVLIDNNKITALPRANFGLQTQTLRWDDLPTLPTDWRALRSYLGNEARDLQGSRDWYVMKFVGDLIAETPTPGALRTALWKVAGSLPDIALDGPGTDRIGREGWGISMTTGSQGTLTYLIDTDTGRILETTYASPREPNRGSRITFVEYGPADTAPQVPPACRHRLCPLPDQTP